MPFQVTFEPAGVTVEVDPADPVYASAPPTVLAVALAHGVHIEHACDSQGACGTCHVIVEQGQANLSPPSDAELDTVEQVPGSRVNSRLACLAVVTGDVTVRVPAWNRNLVGEG